MKVKGIIAYDGSAYYGYQIQQDKNVKTIQGELVKVLSTIFNEETKVYASGRTDRGVHALKQVIHFHNVSNIPLERLKYSLNKMLPLNIRILSLEEVDEDFHARFSVKKKFYQYRIIQEENPFYINYAHTYKKEINKDIIKKGMDLFLGHHNFRNFCGNKEETTYDETIYSFDLIEEGNVFLFNIQGSGFKRYMVRMLIGTLLALNEGIIDLDYISSRLDSSEINVTSYNAPSNGLYLMEVFYD